MKGVDTSAAALPTVGRGIIRRRPGAIELFGAGNRGRLREKLACNTSTTISREADFIGEWGMLPTRRFVGKRATHREFLPTRRLE
jgi:hypothetical protein